MPSMRPAHLSLGLAIAPGGFYGTHSLSYFDTPYIGGQTSIPLNLGRMTQRFEREATPELEAGMPGVEVTPKETRLARLMAGLWFRTDIHVKLKEGFYDANSRNTLLLMYFDRPCHLSGTDNGKDGKLPIPGDTPPKVDIDVDVPGWTWIEIKKMSDSTYTEVRAIAPQPVLLITPHDDELYRKYREGTH